MKYFLIICIVVFTALGIWAFWLEPDSLIIKKHAIPIDNWPEECNELNVAVLADLHVGAPHNGLDKLKEIVQATNSTKPDIILLPGDFVIQGVVSGEFVSPESAAATLADLNAPLGMFAVLGNHDWWLDPNRVENALISHGVTVLEDRSQKITFKNCSFYLVGISDYWEGPHNIELAFHAVPKAATTLVFTHNPDTFPLVPARQAASLLVAGHTHGGQVYLPLFGRLVVPSEHGSRYALGHIVENGQHLFVSSGIGTSILPVRFLVPPEISLIQILSE